MKSPFKSQPRHSPLSHFPTPLHRLHRFPRAFTAPPQIWIKRDDMTTLALGGNKVRKLEFLLGDALECGAQAVITTGSPQSNHCRLTAAACALLGLDCHLVLGGQEERHPQGNVLLDHLFGATLHYVAKSDRAHKMKALEASLQTRDISVYPIPVGGSNGLGATGYALAMEELQSQFPGDWNTIDTIVVPTSSGGTQAGLTVGARALGFRGRILGISIDQPAGASPSYQGEMASIANACAEILGLKPDFNGQDFVLNDDYLGQGYGVLGESERHAITLLAQSEGILTDPVYTGRALAGLCDLLAQQAFSPEETILFWHTGGAPALFAYHRDLLPDSHDEASAR